MAKKKHVQGQSVFAAAEAEQKVSREDFDRVAESLRLDLLRLQYELQTEDFGVMLVFGGAAAAGKSEALDLINAWMDPRWITTHAYGPPSDEERERPSYWRFWRDLPPNGRIGLYAGSWYHQPIQEFVYGDSGKRAFVAALDDIAAFERTLADNGTLILKFWLHMDKASQKKRLKAMEKDKSQSWRVSKQDWKHFKRNDEFELANQMAVQKTDADKARWIVINGSDRRYRSLAMLTTLRDSLRAHIDARRARRKIVEKAREKAAHQRDVELEEIGASAAALERQSRAAERKTRAARAKSSRAKVTKTGQVEASTMLDRLDMTLNLPQAKYAKTLQRHRAALGELCRRLHFEGKSAVILFEGPDAAGKGGAIRRLTSCMDARDYRVIPIAKPSDEERAQHYLWRFWRQLPRAGRITIFDRSWYGRVLVERIEGFAQPDEWQRAYGEINDFEAQLKARGIVVVKFWLHITKEEQYRRFKERETSSVKAWKLTAEDWRNRAKWHDYTVAVDDMVQHTGTTAAPWTLVEANDKKHARVKVIATLCDALRKGLKESA